MAAEKENAKEAAPAAPASGGGGAGWLPVIVILVLVPAISFVMAEYVLFPRLEARLAAASGGGHGEAAPAAGSGAAHGSASGSHGGNAGQGGVADPQFSYAFDNVICNLAGTMKSRYIKVGFTCYSSNPELEEIAVRNRAKLLDATLSILGNLTIADLEESTATIKNKVRSQLIQSYETLLHERVVEEIYFSEWVIQ